MATSRATSGSLLALSAALMFGLADAVAGGVFDEVSPGRVAQFRSIVAVIVLTPLALYKGVLRPSKEVWKLAILGANLALVMFTFYWAIDLLGVGPGATIHFLGPIFVLFWFVLVRKASVRPLVWAAAMGAVLGVGLVTQAWNLGSSDAYGVLIGLIAACSFASYLLLGEHFAGAHDPIHVAVWGFGFASVIWLVALPLWSFPTAISGAAWRDLAIIGIVGTAIPFVVEFAALRLIVASIVGVIATAEPVVAAVAAVILLDQHLELVQWFGVVIVVVAVAAVQRWGLKDSQSVVVV
jgi:inner membrane transporter RhtA